MPATAFDKFVCPEQAPPACPVVHHSERPLWHATEDLFFLCICCVVPFFDRQRTIVHTHLFPIAGGWLVGWESRSETPSDSARPKGLRRTQHSPTGRPINTPAASLWESSRLYGAMRRKPRHFGTAASSQPPFCFSCCPFPTVSRTDSSRRHPPLHSHSHVSTVSGVFCALPSRAQGCSGQSATGRLACGAPPGTSPSANLRPPGPLSCGASGTKYHPVRHATLRLQLEGSTPVPGPQQLSTTLYSPCNPSQP